MCLCLRCSGGWLCLCLSYHNLGFRFRLGATTALRLWLLFRSRCVCLFGHGGLLGSISFFTRCPFFRRRFVFCGLLSGLFLGRCGLGHHLGFTLYRLLATAPRALGLFFRRWRILGCFYRNLLWCGFGTVFCVVVIAVLVVAILVLTIVAASTPTTPTPAALALGFVFAVS